MYKQESDYTGIDSITYAEEGSKVHDYSILFCCIFELIKEPSLEILQKNVEWENTTFFVFVIRIRITFSNHKPSTFNRISVTTIPNSLVAVHLYLPSSAELILEKCKVPSGPGIAFCESAPSIFDHRRRGAGEP